MSGPRRLRGGVIAQSGLNLQPRGYASPLEPTKRPFRAVVVNSRVLGEDGHLRGHCVECDVILIRTQLSIQDVPVLQKQYGVNNVHDLWVPRASTRIVGDTSTPLNINRVVSQRGAYIAPATPLGDLDGDQVLVDFIEGNKDFPIIIGAVPHERSNRQLRQGEGWRVGSESTTRGEPRRDELYTHHYGTEFRINELGDLLIDTLNAYSAIDTEDNSGAGGSLVALIKQTERVLLILGSDEMLKLLQSQSTLGNPTKTALGSDAANEAFVKGDSFGTALSTLLTDWSSMLTGLLALNTALGVAHAPAGAWPEPGIAAAVATLTPLLTALSTSIATFQGKLVRGAAGVLSDRVFGE